MAVLKELSKAQLEKALLDTQSELKRREHIAKAEKEIKAVLRKYSLCIGEIDLAALQPVAKKSRKAKKLVKKNFNPTDKRSIVAAKFRGFGENEIWSGRGRTPKWVVTLCDNESITVDEFKKDDRFIITKA